MEEEKSVRNLQHTYAYRPASELCLFGCFDNRCNVNVVMAVQGWGQANVNCLVMVHVLIVVVVEVVVANLQYNQQCLASALPLTPQL